MGKGIGQDFKRRILHMNDAMKYLLEVLSKRQEQQD